MTYERQGPAPDLALTRLTADAEAEVREIEAAVDAAVRVWDELNDERSERMQDVRLPLDVLPVDDWGWIR